MRLRENIWRKKKRCINIKLKKYANKGPITEVAK